MPATTAPRALRYVRYLMVFFVLRLLGSLLVVAGFNGQLASYFAVPFGIGDTLIGLTALPVAYSLGRGGVRTYALALVWDVAGLADLLLAAGVTTYGGIFGAVNNFFGPGIVLLPIDIVLHFVILGLLLSSSMARHFAGKNG